MPCSAGHYHYFAAVSDSRVALPTFAPPLTTPLAVVYAPLLAEVNASRARASEIQDFAHRIYGTQPAPPPLVLNRLYYDSDYMVHHRAAYTATVRFFSNRTINSECVNTENLQGEEGGGMEVCVAGRCACRKISNLRADSRIRPRLGRRRYEHLHVGP